MTTDRQPQDGLLPNRRGFLRTVIGATGAMSLQPRIVTGAVIASAAVAAQPQPAAAQQSAPAANPAQSEGPALGYESFGPAEIAFVEALVAVMCPADALTPNGVDCGLAVFFDRQLAGGYGKGERLYMRGPWKQGKPQQGYELPLTPEQYFKVGVAAADAASRQRNGKAFDELAPTDADAFLHDLADGKVTDDRILLASWFNDFVYPLFTEACFADPIYGGNVGKVFWKMIGYPGLPATYAQDMIDFRGKPHPGAADPKSIADFS